MKKKKLIDDSGVTEHKDILGPLVVAGSVLVIIGLTVLAVLTLINA